MRILSSEDRFGQPTASRSKLHSRHASVYAQICDRGGRHWILSRHCEWIICCQASHLRPPNLYRRLGPGASAPLCMRQAYNRMLQVWRCWVVYNRKLWVAIPLVAIVLANAGSSLFPLSHGSTLTFSCSRRRRCLLDCVASIVIGAHLLHGHQLDHSILYSHYDSQRRMHRHVGRRHRYIPTINS
jgi:hypothetical protein